ncbi:hypothetical protein [Nostoc sp. DedQUE09]|uniref:hypothetical protein n=1 Tax=Nostoc sp. DedQUE09 TaxID=3075394 RepID=UPI002AD2EE73|nr:hypothetical protein [Nostoc sp. DedQUE09]MDZ7952345.1 hypothetical protein [Nostoc sp. DedQUE09]
MSSVNASNPPAEAAMPTIGKGASVLGNCSRLIGSFGGGANEFSLGGGNSWIESRDPFINRDFDRFLPK